MAKIGRNNAKEAREATESFRVIRDDQEYHRVTPVVIRVLQDQV